MAQFGRALRSGRRGRGFESRRFDAKEGTCEGTFFVAEIYAGHELRYCAGADAGDCCDILRNSQSMFLIVLKQENMQGGHTCESIIF